MTDVVPVTAEGVVASSFEAVRVAFEDLLSRRPGFGAAVAVYLNGQPVVDLWGGTYKRDSLQLLFSATKGLSAIIVNRLAQLGVIDLDAPVASYWPAFAAAGKDRIPVRWLLTHEAGLPGTDAPMTMADLVAREPMIRALEAQVPMWEPGTEHGYHAHTMGFLLGEVVLRSTGETLGTWFAREVAEPLGLSTWIGAPHGIEPQVLPVRTTETSATASVNEAARAASLDPASLNSRVTTNPRIIPSEWNDEAVHAAEIPAGNAITDARSLARVYAACMGEVDGIRILDPAAFAAATAIQVDGMDVVNLERNRFGLGFYLSFPRLPLGSEHAFGHDGFGGTLSLGDPEDGLAFGFTTDRVPDLAGADPDAWVLLQTARACAGSVAPG